MLTFFNNVHQLVVVVALDGSLKGTHMAVQPRTFNIGNDLIHNADQFIIILYFRQNLNSNTSVHKYSSKLIKNTFANLSAKVSK